MRSGRYQEGSLTARVQVVEPPLHTKTVILLPTPRLSTSVQKRRINQAPNCRVCNQPFVDDIGTFSVICPKCRAGIRPNQTRRQKIKCDCGELAEGIYIFYILVNGVLTPSKIPLCARCKTIEETE